MQAEVNRQVLKAAQEFHGHKCPAMPQGLRAGQLALELLGVQKSQGGELLAIIETGDHHFSGCFADGVMFATGCTMGKGNIVKKPLGKFAVTLVDKATRRAVRISAKAQRMLGCLDMEFFRLRKEGLPPQKLDPAMVEPLIEDVLTRDTAEMFDVQMFEDYPLAAHKEDFSAVTCAGCGELVVESYAHEFGGKAYCGTCRDARLHRGL